MVPSVTHLLRGPMGLRSMAACDEMQYVGLESTKPCLESRCCLWALSSRDVLSRLLPLWSYCTLNGLFSFFLLTDFSQFFQEFSLY
jgi:hypothetical protein